MKTLDTSEAALHAICHHVHIRPMDEQQAIACIDAGELVAGVVFDGYNGASIHAHIWVAAGRSPSRNWLLAIAHFPFEVLGVRKVLGQVASDNLDAQVLDEHIGFQKEATIAEYYRDADMILYSLTREQCRMITHPLWVPHFEKFARAAVQLSEVA